MIHTLYFHYSWQTWIFWIHLEKVSNSRITSTIYGILGLDPPKKALLLNWPHAASLILHHYRCRHSCRRQGGDLKDGSEIYPVFCNKSVPKSALHDTTEGGIKMVSETWWSGSVFLTFLVILTLELTMFRKGESCTLGIKLIMLRWTGSRKTRYAKTGRPFRAVRSMTRSRDGVMRWEANTFCSIGGYLILSC